MQIIKLKYNKLGILTTELIKHFLYLNHNFKTSNVGSLDKKDMSVYLESQKIMFNDELYKENTQDLRSLNLEFDNTVDNLRVYSKFNFNIYEKMLLEIFLYPLIREKSFIMSNGEYTVEDFMKTLAYVFEDKTFIELCNAYITEVNRIFESTDATIRPNDSEIIKNTAMFSSIKKIITKNIRTKELNKILAYHKRYNRIVEFDRFAITGMFLNIALKFLVYPKRLPVHHKDLFKKFIGFNVY